MDGALSFATLAATGVQYSIEMHKSYLHTLSKMMMPRMLER
jgi:hypothetical protein